MCNSNLDADFFNNVAAVAVVLIFTKVVTNRSRKAKKDTLWLKRLHVGAVVSAMAAVALSLFATGSCHRSPCIAVSAAVALALTAALLIVDIAIEEFDPRWPPGWTQRKRDVPKSPPITAL